DRGDGVDVEVIHARRRLPAYRHREARHLVVHTDAVDVDLRRVRGRDAARAPDLDARPRSHRSGAREHLDSGDSAGEKLAEGASVEFAEQRIDVEHCNGGTEVTDGAVAREEPRGRRLVRADQVPPADQVRSVDGGRLDRLQRRRPPAHHVRELFRVPAVRVYPRIGAVRDLHARLHGLFEILTLLAAHQALLLDDLLREAEAGVLGDDVVVVVDVGDEVGAALLHEADAFVVDETAVLDRRDAGAHRALDRLRAVGVRGHLPAPHRRLLDYRVELFLRVLRSADRFLFGQDARAREHLDEIRAVLHLEPDLLADLVHAVRYP